MEKWIIPEHSEGEHVNDFSERELIANIKIMDETIHNVFGDIEKTLNSSGLSPQRRDLYIGFLAKARRLVEYAEEFNIIK